jgi:hypothetical protein
VAGTDYTKHVEPVLRPVLAPGEELLAASPLVKDPGTTEDVSVSDELKNALDPTILLGLGTHPGNLAQRAVFGRAVTGAPDSLARRLFAAVDGVTAPTLAVTATRLLVVELTVVSTGKGWFQRWFGPVDQVARVVHEVPRAVILGAVHAPAGVLRRGRFLVGFSDGSGCVLVCSPPGLAAGAVAALGPSGLEAGAPGEEPA